MVCNPAPTVTEGSKLSFCAHKGNPHTITNHAAQMVKDWVKIDTLIRLGSVITKDSPFHLVDNQRRFSLNCVVHQANGRGSPPRLPKSCGQNPELLSTTTEHPCHLQSATKESWNYCMPLPLCAQKTNRGAENVYCFDRLTFTCACFLKAVIAKYRTWPTMSK